MRHLLKRQRGIGLWGLLFFVVLAVFFVTIALKLGPHYMEYLTIRSVMQDLTKDPSIAEQGTRGLKSAVSNRLNINHIENSRAKAFKYETAEGGYDVSVDYEVEEDLFGNVAAVLTFRHRVHVNRK